MSGVEAKLSQLSPKQKALLLKKLADKKNRPSLDLTIQPRNRQEPAPMAFAQQRLWFLQHYALADGLYNIPMFLRLHGALDIAAIEKAFAALIERHELLRTRFYQTDDGVFQTVDEAAGFSLPVEELSGLDDPEQAAQAMLQTMAVTRFDLERGPLFKVQLLRLGEGRHILATCVHHIISDGWSVNVFMRDFSELYQAQLQRRPAVLPVLPIQFADYALWQQQYYLDRQWREDLGFWQDYLQDAPLLLDLPLDFNRPKTPRYAGALLEADLAPELAKALAKLAAAWNVSGFVLMFSAFSVLLARWSGQSSLLIGTPLAGRQHKELENLIGFFVNSLPVRFDYAPQQAFSDYLQQVNRAFLTILSHQGIPFEKIVEAVQPERDESYSPVFQVMFTYVNLSGQASMGDAGLNVEFIPNQRTTAKFDVTLSIHEQANGLSCVLEYDSDLFRAGTMGYLLDSYLTLLSGIAKAPETVLADLPLLSDKVYRQIVQQWNATETDFPAQQTIPDRIAGHALHMPDKTALQHGERQLSYAQLDRAANRLAHRLLAAGVKSGDIVALYLNRGCDQIISILAALKVGAAYLPLDLAYPTERLALMHSQAGAALTVTETVLADKVQVFSGPTIVVDDSAADSVRDDEPNCRLSADLAAYVMFTSGSTGLPKGIAISHAAINRLVLDTNYVYLNADDRVAQVNNTAFDATTFEIWSALLNGGTLVIADRELALSVDEFADFLTQQRISVLLLTTALFNQIVQQRPDAFATLRYVLFGGEKVDPELVAKVLRHGKPEQFLHIYGPTESTTFASSYPITEVPERAVTVPIGHVLSNTRLYVLDTALKPVPVGVRGELYIAGAGLSPYYVHQAKETAAKYLPDPFAEKSGERMYRSGDIVRWNIDGMLEFVGRVDHQVKVRGFRIELSAIETEISAQPEVELSYVKVWEPSGQGKQLLGYFNCLPGLSLDSEQLRLRLQKRLPDYMIPPVLLKLERMPLTPNGKINAKALPEPAVDDYRQTQGTPPETDTEQRLAEIWRQLLAVEAMRESDFFALGGHSLMAMQLANRIQNRFGVKLPVREIFAAPVLAAQAAAIENCLENAEPALTALPEQSSYPLSYAQERLFFLQQLYPDSAAYNMPVALQLAGELDQRRLQQCLDRIVARHRILSSIFVLEGGQPRQIPLPDAKVAIAYSDLQTSSEAEKQIRVAEALAEELSYAFRLDRLPLLRVRLLQTAASRYVLLINNHHILSDGWSQQVFVQELTTLYRSADPDSLELLPPLAIQYADYAIWQRRYLTAEKLESLLNYWRGKLAGFPPAVSLHPDLPRPETPRFIAETKAFTLDAAIVLGIKQMAGQTQCSVFTVLLALFNLFLVRFSGQNDVAIGTPVANRHHLQTENLIGFFVNTLVIRQPLLGQPSFSAFLAEFKQTVLDAFAHQELPFEKLVEALQPQRDLAGTPFFQVFFVYQQQQGQVLELPGLSIEPLPIASREVKFDLTLSVADADDRLYCAFEYNAELFSDRHAQLMADCFQQLVQNVLARPEQDVGAHCLLPEPLYRQMVNTWNACADPHPEPVCLHTLFERSVQKYADRIALEQGERRLSYKQLDEQAAQLAGELIRRGIGPESLVGLCVNRTPRLIVAMLAILKAGGAYVPLDPDYPSARLQNTLEDADVSLLLTEAELLSKHACLNDAPYLLLDSTAEFAPLQTGRAPLPVNLAYILYTSGSTGRPKGVAISHASAGAMIAWAQTVYSPEQLNRVLAGTSICFDLSVFEIFLTLAVGGTVLLMRNVLTLSEQQQAEPTLINTVPSAAEELLRANAIPDSVKTVNLAGEPLAAELVNKLYALSHIEKVYDLYGPSEDTTYSTYTLRQAQAAPTIGRPISHSQAYVLDAFMQPVPVGVPGELYLGGLGLARGYYDRPGLTADKFVPDPFGAPGGRLYRTGDLVSYRPDGNLVYRGRLDHQVKVRGFRIELGEIEALLSSVAEVQECVVVTWGQAAASDRKLIAYIGSDPANDREQLHQTLTALAKAQLPHFMNPSALVIMDKLPLTPNGKIDRKALPDPALSHDSPTASPPIGFVQKTLAGIWRELLGLDGELSVDDDFFELGGHSLLVLDLMTQIKAALGKTLPLAAIFQAPTISALSLLIDKDAQLPDWTPLVPLKSQGESPALFCFHPVGGHVICYNELAKSLPEDLPVYGLRAPGMESDQAIVTQLSEMAAYYLQFIKTVQPEGHYRLLGYSFGGILAYEVARQLEELGDKVDFVAMLDTAHPSLTAEGAAKTDDAELLVALFPALGFEAEQLRLLPRAEQLAQVFNQAKQLGFVPRAMNNEAIERYFNVCRCNLQMSYQPRRIEAPVVLIRAQDGSRRISSDDYLAWRQVAGLQLQLRWLPGQHENMMEPPHVSNIANLITEMLHKND